jgi:ribonuclease HI
MNAKPKSRGSKGEWDAISVHEARALIVWKLSHLRAQHKKFPTHAQALEYIGQGISSEPAPYTKPIPSPPIATAQPRTDRKISPALSAAESLAVKEGYTVSSEGFLVVYCDGSSLGNGKQGAKAGLGIFWGMDGEAERK